MEGLERTSARRPETCLDGVGEGLGEGMGEGIGDWEEGKGIGDWEEGMGVGLVVAVAGPSRCINDDAATSAGADEAV